MYLNKWALEAKKFCEGETNTLEISTAAIVLSL